MKGDVLVHKSFRYLTFIISIYSFLFILPSLLIKKIVVLPILGDIPISILFTGTYFILLDVITEVYGASQAKKTLLAGLFTYTVFVLLMELMQVIPSPSSFNVSWSNVQDPDAYKYLFNNLYMVWISVAFCALFANSINIYILAKWKVLAKGRYFWLRSILTSFFATLIYSVVSNLFAFGFFLPLSKIPYFIELCLISVSAKLLTLVIFAYPALLFCKFLKRAEGVDVYDYKLKLNPLALTD